VATIDAVGGDPEATSVTARLIVAGVPAAPVDDVGLSAHATLNRPTSTSNAHTAPPMASVDGRMKASRVIGV
jgi:hypothetical protein